MHELDPSQAYPIRAEIFRAARLCAPCMDRLGVLTFTGSPLNEAARSLWCDSVLVKHLAPSISTAHVATTSRGFRELMDVDALLDNSLSGPTARRSRAAGRMVALDFRPPACERALARYCATQESGESPGHLTTILSARAAVFHIPPHMALSALIFLEMRSAPVKEFWSCVEACLLRVPAGGHLLRAA
ncbi:MAG: hypothetical protein ACOYM3_33545 [Terrimicrobiaceae bacterium]